MNQISVVLLALIFATACGRPPAAPTTLIPNPSSESATPLSVVLMVAAVPFHAGVAGHVKYEVTNTASLSSFAFDAGNGTGSKVSPASSSGSVQIAYPVAGVYTVTATATTASAVVVSASLDVTVIP